jgi:predicted ArsR family transcriptional regulator
MLLSEVRKIDRSNCWRILALLKASTGLSVTELAKAMRMSYMGVKQHCLELERKGYLDTWRRPKPVGRPEKLYRASPKSNRFFPNHVNDLSLGLLDAIEKTAGGTAPEKMLFAYFQRKGDAYLKELEGRSFEERAESFARLRNQDGYIARCEQLPKKGFVYVEYHNPLHELRQRFGSVDRMEQSLIERVLGESVLRAEETVSGVTRVEYQRMYHLEGG